MATSVSIDAGKIFFPEREFVAAIRGKAADDILKQKGPFVDLITRTVKGSREIDERRNFVLTELSEDANARLNESFTALFGLFSSPYNLPSKGAGLGGGAKRIRTGLLQYTTPSWAPYSPKYIKELERLRKKGQRNEVVSKKKHWFERPTRSIPNPPGDPLSVMVSESPLVRGKIFSTPQKSSVTTRGSRNGFSFQKSSVEWRGVQRHLRKTKDSRVRVAGFEGRILAPTRIPAFDSAQLSGELYDIIMVALLTEQPVSTGNPALGIDSASGPDLLQLLLRNEGQRPMISAFFANVMPHLVRSLRVKAIDLGSGRG